MVGEGPWRGTEQDHAGENSGMETIIYRSGRGRTACSSQGAHLREHASPAFAQPLFRKVLRQLPLRLPSPLPFEGVELEPRQSMKYRSNFNVLDLIKLANKELRPSDTPVYMIFLLGVAAGLRRKEIEAEQRLGSHSWPCY